jgi:hypothetical protein
MEAREPSGMKNIKTFAVGGAVLFAFSLTTSALADKLGTYDLPHVHTELPTPEPLPSLSVPFVSGANVTASTTSIRSST